MSTKSTTPARPREGGGMNMKKLLLTALGVVLGVIVLFYLYLFLTA